MAATFDDHHRPDAARLKDCIHCGFCLPVCPTYGLWGQEMDSPRGRLHLMQQGNAGAPLTETFARHIDLCLGCMACVAACPSGVPYGQLLEATRQQIERRHRRGLWDRLFRAALFKVLPYRGRLRSARAGLRLYRGLGLARLLRATGLLRLLPARLRALESLAPPLLPVASLPAWTAAHGEMRKRVALLAGCVQQAFFSPVNAATVRVLAAEGCGVAVPQDQGCCGALSLHAGREAEAQALARRTIAAFEGAGAEAVVVNAAGCGSVLKEYGHLLRGDPAWAGRARAFSARVRDLSELLVEMEPRAERRPLPLTAAYQDACHLAHAQGIRAQPRALLRAIPGLVLRESAEADVCCGSAGIYNLLEPGAARALGEKKAAHLRATGAEVVVTSNPGCLLQVRACLPAGGGPAVVHLAEVLDASLQGSGAAVLTGAGGPPRSR
jgi:glycolate dehydrogenase iron-sulfur subunit